MDRKRQAANCVFPKTFMNKYLNCECTLPWLSAMQKTQQILDVAKKLWAREGYTVDYQCTEDGFKVTLIDENKSGVFMEATFEADLGVDITTRLVKWRRTLSEMSIQIKLPRSGDLTQYFDDNLGTH